MLLLPATTPSRARAAERSPLTPGRAAPRPRPPPLPRRAGGQWERAAELFGQMPLHGCRPDAITHCALVSAYARGGQWRRALDAFDAAQAAGCQPDAATYNLLLDALWQSGAALAQMRALQLWSAANRCGFLRVR